MEVFTVNKQFLTVVFFLPFKVLIQLVIKNHTNGIEKRIIKIKSILSVEQVNQDIVEIENNLTSKNIIELIESIDSEEDNYEIEVNFKFGYIQEKGGVTYLWHKNLTDIG